VRAGRLVELLVWLQLRGGASAGELAEVFGVSVRTIYRDVEALLAANIPIYTEVGRNGGIRIDPSYRMAGLPRLEVAEARGVLFAVVPAIADQLGFATDATDRTLLRAMEPGTEAAARVVRDRLLVEPTHWFVPPDDTPALPAVATAVWESRVVRLRYRDADVVVEPLGLILKGDTWYLLGQPRSARAATTRLYRLSRIGDVELLAHRFERPLDFDLAAAWAERRASFLASLPQYVVSVRVAPDAEHLLGVLDEGAPGLPLPDTVDRDADGWARLQLRFERDVDGVARHLLQLGADVEVLEPAELREHMTRTGARLAALYRADRPRRRRRAAK
jgi:predicted DNA-binding transcriptional regulator YafY